MLKWVGPMTRLAGYTPVFIGTIAFQLEERINTSIVSLNELALVLIMFAKQSFLSPV